MKAIRNSFSQELQIIKRTVKGLQNTKFYAMLLVSVMLVEIFSISFAISSLVNSVTIPSNGRIGVLKASMTYKSEIRGVFIHEGTYGYPHDWSIIAQTFKQCKLNAMFVSDFGVFSRRPDSEISTAITACHTNGIEYHSVMFALCETRNAETAAIKSDGTMYSEWVQCPIKAHDYAVAAVQDYLNTFPDVDGIMLDYIRYDVADMCYCDDCKATFEAWLGEGPITDWTPFYPDQSRWSEYADWRTIPVTELVRDMRSAALAIKPRLKISLAAWTYFEDTPIYWRKYIGQDTGKWIKEGYLDFVAPMMYTKLITGGSGANPSLESFADANLKYMVGGVEGKLPLVALLRNDWSDTALTPEELKAQIDYVRSRGLDGWIIWRYGGPGSDAPFPDIRDYLSIIDMPDTFSLNHIEVSPKQTEATISWITELPTTSKVEYSTVQLFNASWELWRSDFYYWDINHINGTIVEDNATVTDHSITLIGLLPGTKYYFRIQSQGSGGIATSKVLTFTTES